MILVKTPVATGSKSVGCVPLSGVLCVGTSIVSELRRFAGDGMISTLAANSVFSLLTIKFAYDPCVTSGYLLL